MKGLVQVEIHVFAFSNTPILQSSSTPKRLASVQIKPLNSYPALRIRFSIRSRGHHS